MTNDQFETLAQMIKGVHADFSDAIGGLSTELASIKTETRENFQRVFAHLSSHDDQLRMINKEMLDQGKRLRNLEGFAPEIIDHGRRVFRIEQKLDLPRPALK